MQAVAEQTETRDPAENRCAETEEALLAYLDQAHVQREIQTLVDTNGTTLIADLEDVKARDPVLYTALHAEFRALYEQLRAAFRAYTLRTVGRPLDIAFSNAALRLRLRDLRSSHFGHLVSFAGTATRTTQVRPELSVGTFLCRDCGAKIGGVVQDSRYTPPVCCPNALCTNRTKYDVVTGDSTFRDWQRVHVQEDTSEIPGGSLPRSIEVVVRDGLVEKIRPGSRLIFTGYSAAIPTGPCLVSSRSAADRQGVAAKASQRVAKDFSYSIVFFCTHVDLPEERDVLTAAEHAVVARIASSPDLYSSLSESLFPTIHGHSPIKSAILLMLVGGVPKAREVRLRGDINVLLVGDPGTAKSQFLRQTAAVAPIAVYTSGKSSSAAGLTAAVIRDSETGEFTIEAGALMLADRGVCAIDEFDKMAWKDRVAIHEAMEQQTITIAKAGINATLNARTAVLAAANPVHGRYDRRKTLRQNVNLAPPLMSRFDLFFVLTDDIDATNDRRVALKILGNHDCFDRSNSRGLFPFTPEEVMLYVKYVKDRRPVLSAEGMQALVDTYTSLRQDTLVRTSSYKITARHLESLIRLSEALAKIHNDATVGVEYVSEAARLLRSSAGEVAAGDVSLVGCGAEEPLVVAGRDYTRILNSLVYLVKTFQVGRGDAVERYLALVEDSIASTDALEAERLKCTKTIEFLVESEGILFEVDGVLHVHPNYDN